MISNRVQVGSTVSKFELFAGYVVTDYICTVNFRIKTASVKKKKLFLCSQINLLLRPNSLFFSLFPNG